MIVKVMMKVVIKIVSREIMLENIDVQSFASSSAVKDSRFDYKTELAKRY